MLRPLALAIAFGLAFSLVGCGFQLRGSSNLPYESLYIDAPSDSEVGAYLSRFLRGAQATRIVDVPSAAAAIFQPTAESRERKVVSFNSAGRVRELQLVYRYSFRLVNPAGVDLIPPATLVLTRDLTYDDAQTLAKEQEEDLLWRDIHNDMVQQVVRRLAGRHPAKDKATPPSSKAALNQDPPPASPGRP
jgi:LPS-assembly lipoprotein